ncbi:phosphotransferase [Microlunatus soli]|nr:phosphotransferase [Microlunatus soli]
MTAVTEVIEQLSGDRPIELVRRFDHGAWGTSLALLSGEPVVVKAWPTSPIRERTLDRGIRCAAVMAARQVPIPRLLERGIVADHSYLIYEFVEGEWPPSIDLGLARQMLTLIDRQRDAAPGPEPRSAPALLATMLTDGDATLDIAPARLREHPAGRTILTTTLAALEACDPRNLRTTDIVHGDFAPENLLVRDGEITAVVDWEQARVGDVGFDLAGMIYDIEIGDKADPDVLGGLYRAIHEQLPRDAWRLYLGIYAVRYASWALGTEMEADVLRAIDKIIRRNDEGPRLQ